MDSQQLRRCIAEDPLTRYYTGGVLASDELPSELQPLRKRIFIINTEPASQPGAHWLAVYLPPNQPLEFFDAMGDVPPQSVIQFLRTQDQNSTGYYYQTLPLQSENAVTCGHFCLYYLVHRVRGLSMSTIIQDFTTTDYMLNEQKVVDFVNKYFNTIV